jgi:hypothetical protein
MTIHFDAAVPILRVFDEKLARDFYVGWLGFAWDWEHRFDPAAPIYAQVSRDALRLHLSEHVGDGTPGTIVFLPMTGIREFHSELHSRPWKLYRPGVGPAPWGGLCMDVLDPFGNGLRFAEKG